MSTKIAWTDESWNPVVGCTKVSTGCKNCYAERMAIRLRGMGQEKYSRVVYPKHFEGAENKKGWNGKVYCDESALEIPLHWRNPRKIFVPSMGDLFHPSVPTKFIFNVLTTAVICNWHIFQFLTKRPERMLEVVTAFYESDRISPGIKADKTWRDHLWLGVTCENQEMYNKRWEIARQIPASILFVSMEPLLSRIDFTSGHDELPDWIIIGCESGPGARECKIEWVRDLVKQCQSASVPVFVKQLQLYKVPDKKKNTYTVRTNNPNGKYKRFKTDRIEQFPSDLQIRQYPK